MHSKLISLAARLSDAELLRRIVLLAGREREATVELICHLTELDAHKLHHAEGYGSLFAYCRGGSASQSTPLTTVSKPLASLAGSPSSSTC